MDPKTKKQRARIDYNPIGHKRYMMTTFEISLETANVIRAMDSDEKVIETHGTEGAKLYKLLTEIQGLNFRLVGYCVEYSRYGGFTWKEVEQQLFDAVEHVFGKFKLKREKRIKRFCFWVRQNITQPLFPIWYAKKA